MIYDIIKLREAQLMVVHTHHVIETLDDILTFTVDTETGQRGFLITGNENQLEPYHASRHKIDESIDELARLTSDNPEQQDNVKELRQRIERRLNRLDNNLKLRRDQGFEAVQKAVEEGLGKQEMDAVRQQITLMSEAESRLMDERTEASQKSYRSAIVNGIVTTIAGLVLVVAFAWVVYRNLEVRARAAAALHQEREHLRITLASIGDGVIATDIAGHVTFLNPIAEQLTGWTTDEAKHQPLTNVFNIVNETTREPVENPALRAIAEGMIVGLANHTILINKKRHRAGDRRQRRTNSRAAKSTAGFGAGLS